METIPILLPATAEPDHRLLVPLSASLRAHLPTGNASFPFANARSVFERYYRELLNFLTRKVGDKELAADLTQESYARVYAASDRDAIAEPRALLYTIARNLVTDHHRRAIVRDEVEVPDLPEHLCDGETVIGHVSGEPEAVFSGRQRLAAIEQVLAELPPRPREAFVLYKLDGLSRGEVAEKMGVSVKTVETHLEIAMDACLRRLQELDAGDGAAGGATGRRTAGKTRQRTPR